MNGSLSLSQINIALSRFLHRFHVILFALTIIGGLSVATFMLYQTVAASSASSEPTASANSFDQKTIDKIKGLRDPNEPSAPLQLPSGRTNPFQ